MGGGLFTGCGPLQDQWGTVPWRSKEQTCIALSTAEAKHIALSVATQESLWLKQLIKLSQSSTNVPTTILEDNQSIIAMTLNHRCSKHKTLNTTSNCPRACGLTDQVISNLFIIRLEIWLLIIWSRLGELLPAQRQSRTHWTSLSQFRRNVKEWKSINNYY